MLASEFCIWMVGWSTWMSLSGLHSCIDSFKLVICRGGCMNLLSFDWMCLRHVSYFCGALSSACFLWYCKICNMLCSRSIMSGCRCSSSFHHCYMVFSGTCH